MKKTKPISYKEQQKNKTLNKFMKKEDLYTFDDNDMLVKKEKVMKMDREWEDEEDEDKE